ncbi:hypothetical protein [Rhodococcus sp. 14-2483-1-1]|nr:hypothetical protein [Rhodococcus sp. 14-2483-1-1]
MNRKQNVSHTTDKNALSRAYALTILAGLSIYPAFVGTCQIVLALGWHA